MTTNPNASSPWRRLPPLILGFFIAVSFPASLRGTSPGAAVCLAEEAWKAEFEAVCGKADVADTLTRKELEVLIARCDRLTPQIDAEREPARSFYLRRLSKCSDYYRFMLDYLRKK